METLSIYFLKVNFGLLMMVAAYVLFLRKERYFQWNRAFLLFALVIPFVLPLLPALQWRVASPWPPEIPNDSLISQLNRDFASSNPLPAKTSLSSPALSFLPALWLAYGSVCIWMLLRFSFRLWQVGRLIRICNKSISEDVVFCHHDLEVPAFSFFRWVVLNPSIYPPETLQEIADHEKVHARHWHSVDILMADLLRVVLWINPFARMLKQYITLNLEFAADSEVLASGLDKQHYQLSLLQNSVSQSQNPLVNAFHSSKIKRRIYMINSTRSISRNLHRFLFVLPFILVSYLAVSPVRAELIKTDALPSTVLQTSVEGYYRLDKDSTQYIHIGLKGRELILKQIWDAREIPFEEKTPLLFHNVEHNVDLSFSKDASGEITQLLAFGKDTWIKVKTYLPPVPPKAVVLPAGQMQKYAGKYQMDGQDPKTILQFVVKESGLEVTEVWRNHSFMILPASEKVFFGTDGYRYPVEFSFDSKGNVTQALIFHEDVWKKIGN